LAVVITSTRLVRRGHVDFVRVASAQCPPLP
jgi:hypothetical protein